MDCPYPVIGVLQNGRPTHPSHNGCCCRSTILSVANWSWLQGTGLPFSSAQVRRIVDMRASQHYYSSIWRVTCSTAIDRLLSQAEKGGKRVKPAERQRMPGDHEAQVTQRPIARYGHEHPGVTDRGIMMLRNIVRRGIRGVQEGRDPEQAPQAGLTFPARKCCLSHPRRRLKLTSSYSEI